MRTGSIPECHVAPPDVRDDRQAIRHRISLVQDRTRTITARAACFTGTMSR